MLDANESDIHRPPKCRLSSTLQPTQHHRDTTATAHPTSIAVTCNDKTHTLTHLFNTSQQTTQHTIQPITVAAVGLAVLVAAVTVVVSAVALMYPMSRLYCISSLTLSWSRCQLPLLVRSRKLRFLL